MAVWFEARLVGQALAMGAVPELLRFQTNK